MERILLLDKNYLAISVISIRRAATLIIKGKAESVNDNLSKSIKTGSGLFKIPSIIRLLTTIPYKAYMGRTKFSRKNVMIRDNYECQYCAEYLGKNKGTIDHVVPRSKGGGSDYSNCVACCKYCNIVKADKTPEEAGFKLRTNPRRPTFISLNKFYLENMPREWNDYVIGNANEEVN